jgi:hypothetical protein
VLKVGTLKADAVRRETKKAPADADALKCAGCAALGKF